MKNQLPDQSPRYDMTGKENARHYPWLKRFIQFAVMFAIFNVVLFIIGFANAGWGGPKPTPFWRLAGGVSGILLAPYFLFRELIDKIPFLGRYDDQLGFLAVPFAESLCLMLLMRKMYNRRNFSDAESHGNQLGETNEN